MEINKRSRRNEKTVITFFIKNTEYSMFLIGCGSKVSSQVLTK